jgi:hypothetical protein
MLLPTGSFTQKLAEKSDMPVNDLNSFMQAVTARLDAFHAVGCRIADHSLDNGFVYRSVSDSVAAELFAKCRNDAAALTADEKMALASAILKKLAGEYSRRNWMLLPYEQMLELLDWTADHLAFTLKEEDFLYHKMGCLKPDCEKVSFRALTDEEKVKVCQLAKEAGADFVKTSTGFGDGGATAADVRLMKETVGEGVQVKASTGINSRQTCDEMIAAGAVRMGTSKGVFIVKDELP